MPSRSRRGVFDLELKSRFHNWQTGRKAEWILWGYNNLAMHSEKARKYGNDMKNFLITDGLHEWTWTGLGTRGRKKGRTNNLIKINTFKPV